MSKRNNRAAGKGPILPFCKELETPIYMPRSNLLLVLDPQSEDKREDRIIQALQRKIDLLFQHYGLTLGEEDDWRKLAMRLAFDLVPGCAVIEKMPPKAGRPRYSTPYNNGQLAADIEEMALRKSITPSMACTRLVKSKRSRWGGQSHRALYARYRRYISPVASPESRMAYLQRRLGEQLASPRQHKPGDILAAALIEEPVRRILERPDGTKIR